MRAAITRVLSNDRRIAMIEVTALAGLVALFATQGLIPAWTSLRSDFPNYYIVARLLREHYSMDRIYDWIWLQRIKDHWGIQQQLVGFLGLTPFSALPLVPLAGFEALEAKHLWLCANLAIFGATLYGLHKTTSLDLRRVALLAFLAIIPLRNNFLLGQMHLVVLGLLVLAFWLDQRDRWLSSGVVLGIAASLKIYPLFFAIYFLRKGRWKQALVVAGTTLGMLGACFAIFGAPAMRTFLIEQLPRMLRGEATDPFSLTAPSASSFFHRLFLAQPLVNPHPPIPSPTLYALLYPLWQLCLLLATLAAISPKIDHPKQSALEWAAWTCLLLTLSTEPASYHRVVLILVVGLALPVLRGAWKRAILIVGYFAACNLHPRIPPSQPVAALILDFAPYWALVAMVVCLLIALRERRIESGEFMSAWPSVRVAWATAGFAAVWGVAAATTLVHASALEHSEFVMDRSVSAFARFSPRFAGAHVFTIAMRLQGLRVEDEDGHDYTTATRGIEDDQLAIAASPKIDRIWIEAAEAGRSQLVEIPIAASAPIKPLATIPDAESPALSEDGKSLVFLRESKGIGRAWMVYLDAHGVISTPPVEISPPGLDVRDAAFASSDTVLLSAATDGTPHLYVQRGTELPERLLLNAEAMASPAVGTQHNLIVCRQRRGSYWQLLALSNSPSQPVQLTFGDCNAYDPAWLDPDTLLYISDCGRGNGLGALSVLHGLPSQDQASATSSADSARESHGELPR
jgi:hypothetical protein